ncbi:MAG: hypothetical protein AB8H03_12440 [Saprospiraceae bacterium]
MKIFISFISFLTLTFYSINLQAQANEEVLKNALVISKKNKKNALKVSLLSPLLEHLEISYERVLHPQGNLELSLGRIGFGNFKHETRTIGDQTLGSRKVPIVNQGLFFRTGYKYFFKHPVAKRSGTSYRFFNGLYLQPELTIGSYEVNKFNTEIDINTGLSKTKITTLEKIKYQALLLRLGWQRVLLKHFLIDCSFGVGVGNDNIPRWTSDYFLYAGEFHRGLYKTNGGTTLATYGAIKLGYAF